MYDLLKPVKLLKQSIYRELRYVLAHINLDIIAPFTWEYFCQSSLTKNSDGVSPRKIAGVLMSESGMCLGLSAFYAMYVQNPSGQSFIKFLKAKIKAPELHTAYFEKLLFTQLTPDKIEYKNIQELQDNTIRSLVQKAGLQHLTTIGICMGNSHLAHEIAFTTISRAGKQTEYELFDPNFGIFKTSNESVLKSKILELAIYYEFDKFSFQDLIRYSTNDIDWNSTQNNRPTPLIKACRDGNKAMVKFLLEEKGAKIDLADPNGWTPLTTAVSKDNVEMVKLLLKKGAKIDLADPKGFTPFTSAVFTGNIPMVKLLLEKGAKIDLVDSDGWTPLTNATSKGNIAMVKLLLKEGANANLLDRKGLTPLIVAVTKGDIAMVKLLLKEGANANLPDGKGFTPMVMASYFNHTSIVELLQQALQPKQASWVERFAQSIGHSLTSVWQME